MSPQHPDDIVAIHQRLADRILVALFITALPLAGLSLLRIIQIGWLPVMGVHVALVAALALTVRFRGRLSLAFKAWLLIAVFTAIGAGALLTNESFVWSAPHTLIVVMVAMLFLSTRVALLLTATLVAGQLAHEWFTLGFGDLHRLLHLLGIPALALVVIYLVGSMRAALAHLVTQLQERNDRLLEAREEAINADRAKGEFLANMSHELRTPMNGILGLAELLREERLSPRARGYVEMIGRSGGALLALLNDILDLSKIDANKLELERLPVLLPSLLDDITAMVGVQAEKKGVRLHLEVPEPLPVVASDPIRIRQILLNLVGNAIKFTDQGEIVIDVREIDRDDDTVWIRFSVSDSGIGIEEEKLQHLFQSFHQVDASTARKYGGTGLGLAISKHLVCLMGGEIGVRSHVGEGSEFWFVLPLGMTDAPAPAESAPTPALRLDPEGRRILVAEDHEVNQLITVTFLENLGFHQVDTACDGVEALARIERADYDLVLLDVQMPEIDGLEVARRVRALPGRNRKTPLIALTASAMKGDEELCLRAGMNDYLSKPITSDALAAKLARWLSAAPRAPTLNPPSSPGARIFEISEARR